MSGEEKIFDEHLLKEFSIGDIVSWWDAPQEHCGMIYNIRTEFPYGDNRGYAMADIEAVNGGWVSKGLGQLKLESKVKSHETPQGKKEDS